MEMEKVKLLGTWPSPIVKRVVWALKLKGIEYEITYEDHANKSPQLLKYNPVYKKAPVLVHNEIPICDSLVILEYIDETWKDVSPFLPQDPLLRANERFWAKYGDEQVLPAVYGYFRKQGKDQEEARETTLAHLKRVEQLLNENNFLSGERVGFLDLAFGWLADYSRPLEVVSGVKLLDEDSFPKLCAWRDRFLEIPAVHESWPDQETLIARFQKSKQTLFG
ncbi:putative glutathione transferase [Helianthus annuus]|uniref:glutathione transferase n=1 Tax=Helianthus annuus TaxID=4232 RepID=A0A251V295_HELAN|nr:glutathione transferase GST 23 [Helianthus annuus]KAF5811441.1 putative glutathione transferase [Helianthus annuus]KAJ0758697.1 putative glutathione transferase [Helianthus annuus]